MLNLGGDGVASWLSCLISLIYHLLSLLPFLPDRPLYRKPLSFLSLATYTQMGSVDYPPFFVPQPILPSPEHPPAILFRPCLTSTATPVCQGYHNHRLASNGLHGQSPLHSFFSYPSRSFLLQSPKKPFISCTTTFSFYLHIHTTSSLFSTFPSPIYLNMGLVGRKR